MVTIRCQERKCVCFSVFRNTVRLDKQQHSSSKHMKGTGGHIVDFLVLGISVNKILNEVLLTCSVSFS